jgi:hypothetical protein
MQRLTLLAVVVLAGGCSRSTAEKEISAALDEPSPAAGARGAASRFHSFGAVLAHGQTLRHDFSIANPANTPMRIVRATAFTPCCSVVEAFPESIRPGGEGTVSVNLKAGRSSGRKRVSFILETDSAALPSIQLGLAADFSPEWEVVPVGRTGVRLPMGESGGMGFKVICRRLDREGRGLPERLESSPGLAAKFDGEPRELKRGDGVIETSKTVAITIAGGDRAGPHRGSVRYRWREGLEETQEIGWRSSR